MRGAIKSLRYFLMVLVAIGWQLQVRAQSDTLSNEPAQFYQQLSNILLSSSNPNKREEAKALVLRLDANRAAGRFDSGIQFAIKNLVGSLRQKRLPTDLFLSEYIYNLNLLGESPLMDSDMLAWHHYAQKLIAGKKLKLFLDFMKFTGELLEKHILYRKANTAWYYREGRFSMNYDTVFSLTFKSLKLVKASKYDSSALVNTKGTYFLQQHLWVGSGGRLYWSRFKNKGTEMYASLGTYHFKLTDNIIKINPVVLKNTYFLKKDMAGSVTDKVFSGKTNQNTPYPRFISEANNLQLENIYPEIQFKGGIELSGTQLFGVTKQGVKPEFGFSHGHKIILKLKSNRFKISPGKLEAAHVQVTVPMEKDSIYHPDLQLRYTANNRHLVLYSLATEGMQIPFFDSYHQMDLYVPSLLWDMNSDSLVFKKIRGVNDNLSAHFESARYFSNKEFYSLQGIDELNPLYIIENFTKTYATQEVSAATLAGFIEKPIDQAVGILVSLSNKGFVVYNSGTQTALVKKRLMYFLDAKARRTDFDVIHFTSDEATKTNASLNLKNLSLNIYGVPRIFISNSQHVYIYPYKKKISVHKNRDFSFNGKVSAGLFNFYAHNSTFVYDSFMINLNYVDSLTFSVLKKDSYRKRTFLIPVKNSLQKLTGRLYVDLPFNKSGQMHVPKYPVFVSESESYVYFNRRSIQDSTLVPDRFYYRIEPFTFDSLMTFKTNGLTFQGQLFSDSIFPSIHQPIRVMPDYSLGFIYKSPKKGLPLYSGLGTFADTISLSNKGFIGKGVLTYLTTTSHSPQYVFYPDSVIAEKAFHFQGRIDSVQYNYPSVKSDSVSLDWNIPANRMQLKSLNKKTFELYGKSYLRGILNINPEQVQGKGVFSFDQSEIESNKINFTHKGLTADTAKFILKGQSKSDTAFIANNYFAQIDFIAQKGWFSQLGNHSFVKFPQMQYRSTLTQLEWIMRADKLILSDSKQTDHFPMDSLSRRELISYNKPAPEFISLNPDQKSLRFYADKAEYNMNLSTIDVEGVKVIKIADAAIFPEHEAIKILKDGKLANLVRASILTDTMNLYHNIYNASLNIQSKKSFTGSGTIDYKDINATSQPIQLPEIFVRNGKTVARGNIAKDEVFFLSPEYFFTGKVIMHSDHQFLRFRGGYQMNEGCVDNVNNWVAFSQELDPYHIAFHLSKSAHTADSLKAYIGLAFNPSNYNFYPLIFQAKKKQTDEILLSATGDLSFDPQTAAYRLGSQERMKNNDLKKNYIQLDTKKCILSGDGIMDMNLNTHLFKTKTIGRFTHYIIPDSTTLDVVLMLDFHFDEHALELMADSMRFFTVKSINKAKGLYPMALKKLLDKQTAGVLLNELTLYGQIKKLPTELKSSITFTDLHLVWDKASHSFLSSGPIGIGSIGNSAINKQVHGIVQIEKNSRGGRIHFMLSEGHQWYFFTYANGILEALSSDNKFNSSIGSQKAEKRILNPHSLTNFYKYVVATSQKRFNFIRSMKILGRLK